jgi:hypothetical protein
MFSGFPGNASAMRWTPQHPDIQAVAEISPLISLNSLPYGLPFRENCDKKMPVF